MLINMKIADFPQMKKNDRSKLHRSIHKKAYPEMHNQNKKEYTTQELAQLLGGKING